jgi:hypothetical protein
MGFVNDIFSGIGGIMGGFGAMDSADAAEGYYDQAGVLTDAQARLANQQADMSAEQWNYWKQLFLPIQQQLSADQLGTYLPLKRAMAEQYQNVYMPFENQMFQDVQEGIKPNFEEVMGKASGDVEQAFSKAQDASNRGLMRYGINPNSGRFAGNQRGLDIAKSAMDAGSRTLARERETRRIEDVNWSRKAALYGMKRGLPVWKMPTDFSGNALSLSNFAMSGLGNAAQGFGGLGDSAYKIGKDAAYGLGAGLQSFGKGLGSLFGKFDFSASTGGGTGGGFNYSSGLGSGLSIGSTDLGTFPTFAKGGPIPGNQPAIVGEEGPELYVKSNPGSSAGAPPHRGGMSPRHEEMIKEAVNKAFQAVFKTSQQRPTSDQLMLAWA